MYVFFGFYFIFFEGDFLWCLRAEWCDLIRSVCLFMFIVRMIIWGENQEVVRYIRQLFPKKEKLTKERLN